MEKTKINETLSTVSKAGAIIGSLMMLISLFLPYITGGYGFIKENSMVSYVQLSFQYGSEYMGSDAFGIIMLLFVGAIGLFSLLTLIFSARTKPIKTIVFAILAGIVFAILCWDFKSRGVVSESGLKWGIAYYLFIIGIILSFIGAVCMTILNNKNKKAEAKNDEN